MNHHHAVEWSQMGLGLNPARYQFTHFVKYVIIIRYESNTVYLWADDMEGLLSVYAGDLQRLGP